MSDKFRMVVMIACVALVIGVVWQFRQALNSEPPPTQTPTERVVSETTPSPISEEIPKSETPETIEVEEPDTSPVGVQETAAVESNRMPEEARWPIRGNVTDDLGVPISGARIRALHWSNYSAPAVDAVSDEDGTFVLPIQEAGRYNLQVNAAKHSRWSNQFPAGSEGAHIILNREGIVSGTVVDAYTDEVISKFMVQLVVDTASRAHTPAIPFNSAEGQFTVAGIDPNMSMSLVVKAEGHAETQYPLPQMAAGATLDGVVVRMNAPNSLIVEVVDEFGQAIEGANVQTGITNVEHEFTTTEWEATSDEKGQIEFKDLALGEVSFLVKRSGYQRTVQTVLVNETNVHHRVVMKKGAHLDVQVTLDGEPVNGAEVSIQSKGMRRDGRSGGEFHGYTKDDGIFLTNDLFEDTYLVAVMFNRREPDQRTMFREVTVSANSRSEMKFEFESAETKIFGQLLTNEQIPVRGTATLREIAGLTNEIREQQTDSEGRFQFESVPSGTYMLSGRATDDYFMSKSAVLNVGHSESLEQRIVFNAGLDVSWTVSGLPDNTYAVLLLYPAEMAFPFELDDDELTRVAEYAIAMESIPSGTGQMNDIEPGTYQLLMVAVNTEDPDRESIEERKIVQVTIENIPDQTIELSF